MKLSPTTKCLEMRLTRLVQLQVTHTHVCMYGICMYTFITIRYLVATNYTIKLFGAYHLNLHLIYYNSLAAKRASGVRECVSQDGARAAGAQEEDGRDHRGVEPGLRAARHLSNGDRRHRAGWLLR